MFIAEGERPSFVSLPAANVASVGVARRRGTWSGCGGEASFGQLDPLISDCHGRGRGRGRSGCWRRAAFVGAQLDLIDCRRVTLSDHFEAADVADGRAGCTAARGRQCGCDQRSHSQALQPVLMGRVYDCLRRATHRMSR
jgi:hypothetical protein